MGRSDGHGHGAHDGEAGRSIHERLFGHAHDAEPTCEGRSFPDEGEWLGLPAPPVATDFVERTLHALAADRGGASEAESDGDGASEHDAAVAGHLVTPQMLRLFAPPEPSSDFVVTTLRAVQQDRRRRWRELLARHIAPEPSPEFVARTLRALAHVHGETAAVASHGPGEPGGPGRPVGPFAPRRLRVWLPVLAVAATAVAYALLGGSRPPFEVRIAEGIAPAYAHAYAASPLPVVLAALAHEDDPLALPVAEADGAWLLAAAGER